MTTRSHPVSRRTRSVLLGVVTLMLIVAMPAVAATQRPFRASYEGSAGVAQPRCGSDVTLGFLAVGTATHLGRLEANASNCTDPSFPVAAVDVRDGIATFVAADGSTITAAYEGRQEAPVAGIAAYTLTMTAVGGTGRFEDVSGRWTASGLLDFNDLTIDGTLDGWIAY